MATLQSTLESYRTTQATGHAGLLSKLQIGTTLYDIKDPAVEALAAAVEERLSAQENKTWTAVTKDANAAKFATAVTQGTDGAITVTYGTIRDAALTDTSTTNQVVKGIAQSVDGVVTATMGQVAAGEVSFSETNWTATDAKAAILEALSKAIGSQSDLSSADTINAAKKYADEAVAALAGQDWEQNAKKVQEIIAEIENSENGNSWLTAIDKLAGMAIQKTGVTAAEVAEYNEHLTGAIKGGDVLTAEQATAVNAAVSGANYSEGQKISAADSITYNAQLQGALSDADPNATWTDTNVTVKEYVDNAVANATGNAAQAIAALDATVGSTTVASGKHVAVQVVETDGVLTGVTVTEDDIASAQDLEDLTNTVEEHAEVTAAALTDLDSRITAIDLTTKANKAAITTGTINNWTSSYTAGTETLSWSNTETTVYVPVSGQSL